MIFLNEKFTAILFAILCFVISLVSGIAQGIVSHVTLTRALVFSFIGLIVGFVFGKVIKDLFLETIETAQKKGQKEKEEAELRRQQIEAEKVKNIFEDKAKAGSKE